LLQGLLRALAKQRQLEFAHRPLHPKQQPIIRMARIVDSVLVDDDGPDQSTELDQRVPVATVARQSRRFDRQHGAHASLADCSQQALETRSGDAAARATEIIVDNFDGGPAKLTSAIGKAILPMAALMIVHQLIGRRLANIDIRAAREMLSRDLGHRQPSASPARSRSRTAELAPEPPDRSSARPA